MKFHFNYIVERDADFAIIRSFTMNKKVRKLFFKKNNLKNPVLLDVYHSLVQTEPDGGIGESDIVFVLKNKKQKFGILIEDKINANPQPNQRNRYYDRGEKMKLDNVFDDFVVFLCAPNQYLNSSLADGYENKVSYESIIDRLDNCLDKEILIKACENDNLIIKDDNVTEYWYQLYAYVYALKNPNIVISGKPTDKSSRSLWPTFKTAIKGCTVVMKTDRGFLDLELPGMGNKAEELYSLLNTFGMNKNVVKTGKSASIRIKFDETDWLYFVKDFNDQKAILNKWLDGVEELTKLAAEIKNKELV